MLTVLEPQGRRFAFSPGLSQTLKAAHSFLLMGGKARCPGHPLELGGRTAVYKWGLRAEGPRPLTDCGYGSLACGRWLRGPHLETWDTVPAEGLRLSARVPSVSSPEGSPSLCILPQTHLILKTGPPTRPAWGRGPPPLTPYPSPPRLPTALVGPTFGEVGVLAGLAVMCALGTTQPPSGACSSLTVGANLSMAAGLSSSVE